MAVWVSHVVEAVGLAGVVFSRFVWVYCRINRVFESSKATLAQVSGKPTYLWAEYELGLLGKAFALTKLLGICQTLLAVTRNEACERCSQWKGIEHRSHRGTHNDRSLPDDRVHMRRFTDDSRLVTAIRRGPSNLRHAA
jgi:hypothetical protein